MIKEQKIILELIKKEFSLNEISQILNLSSDEMFEHINRLKNIGYLLSEKYYYNGEVRYFLNKSNVKKNNGFATIITKPEDKEIKLLFLSDLHLGNKKSRIDLLDNVYEFSIKNNINNIINCGDILDGPYDCGMVNDKEIIDYESQLSILLNEYPYDKNIINYFCFGNHDYTWIKEFGIDLRNLIRQKRTDIVPLSFGNSTLYIKNDSIGLRHCLDNKRGSITSDKYLLKFHGHSHKYKCSIQNNYINVFLPSLSNLPVFTETGKYEGLPSFVTCGLKMIGGYFNNIHLEQYVLCNNNIIKISEFVHNIDKKITQKIDNEENILPLLERNKIDLLKMYKTELNLSDEEIYNIVTQKNVINNNILNNELNKIKKLILVK